MLDGRLIKGSNYTGGGIKPKDLVMIPFRVALAAQEAGWWVRSVIVWAKNNPMPESVRDRPTTSHEYVLLMAKSKKYYYDQDAIREPNESGPSDIKKMLEGRERIGGKHKALDDPLSKASAATNIGKRRAVGLPTGRNKRSVWTINTRPYKGAHYATFPPDLIEPMILAGCPPGGIVLDPFAGTGTIAQKCIEHGRDYVVIDIDPKNKELMDERLSGTQVRLSAYA